MRGDEAPKTYLDRFLPSLPLTGPVIKTQPSVCDMMDGWGWHAIQAGLQRRRGGRWEVEDVDVNELNQRFVSLPNGLILQFNLDWYVIHPPSLFASTEACHPGSVLPNEVATLWARSISPLTTTRARNGSCARRRSSS